MRRILIALSLSLLMLGSFAAPAAAKCPICLDDVSLQTPDGQPWSDGKPVTLVVSARRGDPAATFPATALAVVMQTDRERTKCLDVPLKLVSTSGDTGVYAGVFYPFRAAYYTGKVQLGDETFDMSFDVATVQATAPVAKADELPAARPESAAADTLGSLVGMVPLVAIALAFWSGVALLMARWRPRPRTA